jgi:hypothetical protein
VANEQVYHVVRTPLPSGFSSQKHHSQSCNLSFTYIRHREFATPAFAVHKPRLVARVLRDMAARWDIAAVVVALMAMLVSASRASLKFFHHLIQRLFVLVLPAYGGCRRISWNDIPDGLLHQRHPQCQHVNGSSATTHKPNSCWDDSIGKVLNSTWSSVNSNTTSPGYIIKPYDLPLSRGYIQMDVQISQSLPHPDNG